MNFPRLWRTARYLSAEQVWYVAVRRLRHAAWRRWSAAAQRRIARTARTLPRPVPQSEELRRVAIHVAALQSAVHGRSQGIARGHFDFLGRVVDFGGLDRIDWRRDLGEESSPLWRLTLAYFGWAVPLLLERGPDSLSDIAAALAGLERSANWSMPGVFRDLWNPYTASHRLINLLSVVALNRAAGGVATSAEAAILEHVRFCAAYIAADLERDLQLNHLLKNYVALAVFAASLPSVPPVLGFLEQAVPRLLRQVVLSDGGHAELSPMYHALGLLDLRLLRDSGLFAGGWQPDLDLRIAAMERALACLTHPDGDIALFSDSWLGGAPSSAQLGLPRVGPGRRDLPASGYVRLATDGECLIFDCGPIGPDFNPAHGHADYLAIEASMDGHRLLVDFGTPTYAAGPLRDLCRSATAHNGPRLIGVEPAELWKSFRVGRRGRAMPVEGPGLDLAPLWAAGMHDGYAPMGVEVRRWVGLWPGQGFMVVDSWRGGRGRDEASDFLLPDLWRPQDAGSHLRLEGPVLLDIIPLAGRLRIMGTSEQWPRYGEPQPTHGLRLTPDGGVAAAAFVRHGLASPLSDDAVRQLCEALNSAWASTAVPA